MLSSNVSPKESQIMFLFVGFFPPSGIAGVWRERRLKSPEAKRETCNNSLDWSVPCPYLPNWEALAACCCQTYFYFFHAPH